MDTLAATSADTVAGASTEELRRRYLIRSLFERGRLRSVYCHEDRLVVAGIVPAGGALELEPDGPVRAARFLENREAGILHVGGGPGVVRVDGDGYELEPRDMLYLGRGARTPRFESASDADPARFYVVSAVAHRTCPDALLREDSVAATELGSPDAASHRELRKYVGSECETAALMMGVTTLRPGSVWNTMPAHVHDRRTEIYLYFDLAGDDRVVHLMGAPLETRCLVVANEEAVVSPPWSIHSGVGTAPYRFCWAMAGENTDYTDMDPVPASALA